VIKAIETEYNGFRFRSKLEARWQVFFNSINVPSYYEYQGYDLDGIWYLPDFFIPKWKCFIEAKNPDVLHNPSRDKELKDCVFKCADLSRETKSLVILIFGGFFGKDNFDEMIMFFTYGKSNLHSVPLCAVAGEGKFGKCKGTDVIYLKSYEPNLDQCNLVRSLACNIIKPIDIKLTRNREWLLPLQCSIGFDFGLIKENNNRELVAFSNPFLSSVNASFFDRFIEHKNAYIKSRQERFEGHNGKAKTQTG